MSFPQIERLLQLDELIRSSQRHTQASLAEKPDQYSGHSSTLSRTRF